MAFSYLDILCDQSEMCWSPSSTKQLIKRDEFSTYWLAEEPHTALMFQSTHHRAGARLTSPTCLLCELAWCQECPELFSHGQ